MKPELVVIANQKVAVNTFSLLVQRKYAPSAHYFEMVKIHLFVINRIKRTNRPFLVTRRLKGSSSNFQFEVDTA